MKKREKQSRFFGCLIAIGIFLIIIGILSLIKVTEYAVYKDAGYGIQIKYPTYWALYDKPEGGAIVAFVVPKEPGMDVFVPNVNVTMNDLSGTFTTQDQFSKTIIRQVTKTFAPYIKVLESKRIKLAGRPGYRFVYAGQIEGNDNPMQYLHAWVVDGDRAYIITYAALKGDFKKHHGIVRAMMKSFKLTTP